MSTNNYAASGLTVYIVYRPYEDSIIGAFSNDDEAEEYVKTNCVCPEEVKIKPMIVDDEL